MYVNCQALIGGGMARGARSHRSSSGPDTIPDQFAIPAAKAFQNALIQTVDGRRGKPSRADYAGDVRPVRRMRLIEPGDGGACCVGPT